MDEGGNEEDERLQLRTCTTPDASWLPPEPTLTKCVENSSRTPESTYRQVEDNVTNPVWIIVMRSLGTSADESTCEIMSLSVLSSENLCFSDLRVWRVEREKVDELQQHVASFGTLEMGGAASREAAMSEVFLLVKQGKKEALRQLLVSGQLDVNAFFPPNDDTTLLYYAVYQKQREIITLLLEFGARVDIGNEENGKTPLHKAVSNDDKRVVSLLLAHGADVNAVNKYGFTPLFSARSARVAQILIENGADTDRHDKYGRSVMYFPLIEFRWEVVKLLVHHGANINHVSKDGENALHLMARYKTFPATVNTLVELGAEINGRDVRGRTPLLAALYPNGAKYLLAAGADVNAYDADGRAAIHIVLGEIHSSGVVSESMRCLQVLVSHGAKWDEQCEKWLASISAIRFPWQSMSHDVARAVRLCIRHWMEEYKNGLPPTDVPEEDIKRGFQATKTYLDQRAKSTHVVLRRKICVVGPSNWGKTSLVKSLVTEKPNLVHPDDRTIGIDKFKFAFDQQVSAADSVVHHEVTFWDFAGQDEYQVAHSLFFSRRTLYLVCVDLSAYAAAYYKAEMMTGGDPMALNERMNAFVETRILRWIRLILARQPDAEFHIIGTKNDLIQVVDADALADMKSRLANVLMIIRAIMAGDKGGITHLGDTRLERMAGKSAIEPTFVSCTQYKTVGVALGEIKNLVCKSERSYAMPDSYSAVLQIIKEKRKAAQESSLSSRIDQCFIRVDALTKELAGAVTDIDQSTSRDILRALRDIGDVLWYEDVDDTTLRETVVLDPLLLIDLIRKIFNHQIKSEVLFHSQLQQLEVWKYLVQDDELMLAMKRLLQKFHLAYPTDRDIKMQWDSDLMLPPSWRTKTSAQLMFMGQPLNHPYGVTKPRDWQVDVHWVLEINSGFDEALFDRLVVATYEPAFMPRQVGPDYILYGDATSVESQYACRLIVDWHRVTHKRVLHLEAVLGPPMSSSSSAEGATVLWDRFQCLCQGLAAVLATFPGLRVSSSARMVDEWPRLATCTRPVAKWLPPEPTLSECRGLLTQRRAAPVALVLDSGLNATVSVESANPTGEAGSEKEIKQNDHTIEAESMASPMGEPIETSRPPAEPEPTPSPPSELIEATRPPAKATDEAITQKEIKRKDRQSTIHAILPEVATAIVVVLVAIKSFKK